MEQIQYLFIHTDKCEGTPSNFRFTIPQNLITCNKDTERLRVSLIKWTCRHDWTVVRQGNNIFTVQYGATTTTITIPDGNYTYTEYASKIQTLMNAQALAMGVSSGVILVEYLAPSNHLKITFPNALTRVFNFPAQYLANYGMSQATYTITNTVLESDVPIDFYKNQERLYIYCQGLNPKSFHRSLVHGRDGEETRMEAEENLLASVLINNYPYETIVFEDDGTMYGRYLSDNKLYGTLHFTIKTINNIEADFIPDSHMVLKVEKETNQEYRHDESLQVQKDIREYLRLMFLSQNMPPDLPDGAVENPQ